MTNDISSHYESHTSTSYESAFFYSEGEYTKWLCDLVRDTFNIPQETDDDNKQLSNCCKDKADDQSLIRKKRVLLDVGGGTGNFTSMVIQGVDSMDAVVVDPFLPATTISSVSVSGGDIDKDDDQQKKLQLKFVKASAEEFIPHTNNEHTDNTADEKVTWWKTDYNHILLKEVVHHFDSKERVGIFTGLLNGMLSSDEEGKDNASLLIVTRPQIEIDYPMWPAAKEVWAANQPSADDIESDLHSAGFKYIRRDIKSYPCGIKLETWLGMVRNRFWSTFSHFTNEEIEVGCDIIAKEARPDEEGKVKFEERLLFITAKK
jgi:hypothetical protein